MFRKIWLENALSWPLEKLSDALSSVCVPAKLLQLGNVHTLPPDLTSRRPGVVCTLLCSLIQYGPQVGNPALLRWLEGR